MSQGGLINRVPGVARLVTSVHYVRDPYGHYARIATLGADPLPLDTVWGTFHVALSAATARHVYSADPSLFAVGGGQEALEPLLGQASAFLVSGAAHGAARRLLTPSLHGPRLTAAMDGMRAIVRRECALLRPGQRLVLSEWMRSLSLQVMLEVVLGLEDAAEARRIGPLLLAAIDRMHPALVFFPALQRAPLGRGPWAWFQRARAEADAAVYHVIGKRRASGRLGDDVLSLLLAARLEDGGVLTDAEIRDHLVTLLFAGHETTASAMSWAVYHLLEHPDILARVLEELRALGEDAPAQAMTRLPLLGAVCDETLRLYPIVLESTRKLRHDWELNGVPIPAGGNVSVSILRVHRDPLVYPDPETFEPARFLERTFRPWEFVPYGGGARRCLGAAMASSEMRIVLGTLLSRVTLRRPDSRPERPVRRSVTMAPGRGVPVEITAVVDGGAAGEAPNLHG